LSAGLGGTVDEFQTPSSPTSGDARTILYSKYLGRLKTTAKRLTAAT